MTTNVDNAPPGEALVQELLWVHGIIRRDLATLTQLADQVLAGVPAAEIRSTIAALESQSPLWKIRVTCLHYCRFVHKHHTIEDHLLFPALRESNPALGPVVDRLEADHLRVAEYCAEVVGAANALANEDSPATRQHVVDRLGVLADHLLAHLAYEEEMITPTMRGWARWPSP